MLLTYSQERKLVSGILTAAGLSSDEGNIIGRAVAHSDFTGVYSHGLSRLTRYLRQIKCGALNPKPEFRTLLAEGNVMLFDGDNGSGIVSLNRAYDAASVKARENGVVFATVRHSANIGCGSYYGLRAVEDGLVCIAGCNTYAFTSPYGGADRIMGTNPIIFAAPAGDERPVIMDISTTIVAMGKIQAMEREGKEIPIEWAKDYEGRPTVNPAEAFSLSPIAAHKGYGLAVMVDILSTMFSSAAYGSDIGLFSKLEKEDTGSFLILIDPEKFMPLADFKKRMDRYIRMMKGSRKAPGVSEIYLPGELEFIYLEENMKKGITFSPALEEELIRLAIELGVVPDGTDFPTLVAFFDK